MRRFPIALLSSACALAIVVSGAFAQPSPEDEATQTGAVAARGFHEPSHFARSLIPNPRTADAPDRGAPTFERMHVWSVPDEIWRHSTRSFTVDIPRQPILALLRLEIWQQGTAKKPEVVVNEEPVTELEIAWPSLAHRNFIFFLWDDEDGEYSIAYDYQGWLDASAPFDGSWLKPGINRIGLRVELDQVKFRNVTLELLYGMDEDDTIHDFRRDSRTESIPLIKREDETHE